MIAKKSISINTALLTLAATWLVGCGGEKGELVRQSEYGQDWPFTVGEGRLSCVYHSGRRQIVTFLTSDGEYALNGNARDSGFFQ